MNLSPTGLALSAPTAASLQGPASPDVPSPHPDRFPAVRVAPASMQALEALSALSDGEHRLLATLAADALAADALRLTSARGAMACYAQAVTVPDDRGEAPGQLSLSARLNEQSQYAVTGLTLAVPARKAFLSLTLSGANPMNSDGHVDIKRCVADHLPGRDLMSLARTSRAHYSLFYREARALRRADRMATLLWLPPGQRLAAATAFLDAVADLHRPQDETERSNGIYNLAFYFACIPESERRTDLARRLLSLLPDLPLSDVLARTVMNINVSWLPVDERAWAVNAVLFPLMDRLIAGGFVKNTSGFVVRDQWRRLEFLPPDAQAAARSRIEAMVDAMIATGTPLRDLPWINNTNPALSIGRR